MNYKDTYTWKEINETPELFGNLEQENEETMNVLVSAIKDSGVSNIVAAARGASNHAVVYFKYVLEVMSNFTVGLSAPSIVTMYRGKVNYSNSIVLGVSSNGEAKDVLEVIKKGNENGAITVAMTNDKSSSIARAAKFHLYLNAGEKKSCVSTKIFNSELYMLLWLASAIAGKRDNLKMLKMLKIHTSQIMPQIDELTTKYAEKFRDMKTGFVLSRGLTYAIALYASHLMQETCYIPINGYPTSEFYHGPLALVNSDTPVIIYCSRMDGEEEFQSEMRADQIRCVEKMLSIKAPVLLITNDCVLSGRFAKCNDAHLALTVPEEFSVFMLAIFAQMFACKLSCLIGNNPDTPREMSVHTITK